MYIGTFIRRNGELRAIIQIENRLTTNMAAERKIYKDKKGTYVIIRNEKRHFDIPDLQKTFEKDGVEYFAEKHQPHFCVTFE